MDNLSHHSVKIEKNPVTLWKKVHIINTKMKWKYGS